jgi:hypothetical protein
LVFVFEEINRFKSQLKSEKLQAEKSDKKKVKFFLSTEIYLTTSNDEVEEESE